MPFFLHNEFPIGTRNNACATCNSDRRPTDRLVDLGVTIDFEGYLVMCETCAREIAQLLGYETADISEQLRGMRHEIGTLRLENERYKAVTELAAEALSG